MTYLLHKGVEPKQAFQIMEDTRKGKAPKTFTPERVQNAKRSQCAAMVYWQLSENQVHVPESPCTAYVTAAIKLGWFKLYHPLAYYAVYFSTRGDDFDAILALQGKELFGQKSKNLRKRGMTVPKKNLICWIRCWLSMRCLAAAANSCLLISTSLMLQVSGRRS